MPCLLPVGLSLSRSLDFSEYGDLERGEEEEDAVNEDSTTTISMADRGDQWHYKCMSNHRASL